MSRAPFPTPDLTLVPGIGVAGNVAGHLEQAGETADFERVQAAAAAPKGIFPWYVPAVDGSPGVVSGGPATGAIETVDLEATDDRGIPRFLTVLPLSARELRRPAGEVNLQLEPEMAVLFDVTWEDGRAVRLAPTAVGAFDDCSIRRPGARKISHKKHWGPASKGLAGRLLPVSDLEPGGSLGGLRLASFLRRGGSVRAYGVDTPVDGYTYIGAQLIDWLLERLAAQRADADTPLEDVGGLLSAAGCHPQLLVGIGATTYTELGASTFLDEGDEVVVVLYPSADGLGPDDVLARVQQGGELAIDGASVLTRTVIAG